MERLYIRGEAKPEGPITEAEHVAAEESARLRQESLFRGLSRTTIAGRDSSGSIISHEGLMVAEALRVNEKRIRQEGQGE
jgi:hypothetical protein